MQRKYDVLRLTALASLAISMAAVAQQPTDQTNPPATPSAETPAPSGATEETPAEPRKKAEEEIVVTGSRVRRKDLTTPAPVTVISREQMITSGRVSLGDFLQTLPEQGNAINTGVNNGGDGSTRVSLRGIGDARTLVLVNGRRMVPGGLGADPSVDLNSIPTAAIERIEVLKDGASAIYGSDAIAGVVNIITRRRYTGTELSAYSGVAGHGDGFTYDLAATSGTAGDNGSLLFSAGFFDQRKIMAGDRDFSMPPAKARAKSVSTPPAARERWAVASAPTAPATPPGKRSSMIPLTSSNGRTSKRRPATAITSSTTRR